jgi:hypothetical protein
MSTTTTTTTHRRLIVELCHGGADARTLRAAAEFARLLGLDLHGLFIEDEALLHLADLPFAREIRLPTHQWHPVEAHRITAELEHAAAEAQRLLRQAATTLGVRNMFEVRRGDPAETIATISSAGDIIVIAAPTGTGARLAPGFAAMHAAAHASAASVLLLPEAEAPRHGPVVAVLTERDDPALPSAAVLAAAAREDLLLLLIPDGEMAAERDATDRAATLGVPRNRVAVRKLGGLQPEDILHALGGTSERLLVMTSDASAAAAGAGAARIAAARGVPVLLVQGFRWREQETPAPGEE